MNDKYNITKDQNIFLAKRCVVDSIWKSSHIEGIDVTYTEIQRIYDGGNVARLRIAEIQTINDLNHAWLFVLNSIDAPNDLNMLKSINGLVGSNLVDRAGQIRIYEVSIGGTTWKPEIPDENKIIEDFKNFNKIKCITERAITIMCYLMRTQFFTDGNKRTAMLFANKIMIQNGKGVISIPVDEDIAFGEKLIKYYETNDMTVLKQFIYDKCINGIEFSNT